MAQLMFILVLPRALMTTYAIERNAKVAFLEKAQPGRGARRLHWGVYLAVSLFFATCSDFIISLIHLAGKAPVVGSIQF
jgi:hypothetical protein